MVDGIVETLVSGTVTVASAYLSRNEVLPTDVPKVITSIFGALANVADPTPPEPTYEPVVSVRASVKPVSITCLACGQKAKMLKRHLQTAHGLEPDEYRARYGLSADYPLVAPLYAETRRKLAKQSGLGRNPNQRRGRRRKAVP